MKKRVTHLCAPFRGHSSPVIEGRSTFMGFLTTWHHFATKVIYDFPQQRKHIFSFSKYNNSRHFRDFFFALFSRLLSKVRFVGIYFGKSWSIKIYLNASW